MRPRNVGQMARRAIVVASVVMASAGAAAVAATESGPTPTLPVVPAVVAQPSELEVFPAPGPAAAPVPADVVTQTGSWFAHGTTLDLWSDGTGLLATWVGAFDGDRLSLRLIPAPGPATVAEIVAIETVGQGALAPDERPGLGGLVTVIFDAVPHADAAGGEGLRTAHVEWTSGPHRHAVDLCPAHGLDAAAMETLGCGA